ncbi:hypothetical protein EPUS_04889 [Endocarpon pusillum Z07020]|uniref:Uncharacterized protein n=1 Tax=Endocarpon pusillum (strain Z07020 / HMAS-L-300199) TaxID=1263415 RepID=U1HVK0_ENDPU|nr:uncharacterized protein EPUS_04889 [Endocarpon pusillum Z07020]ERF74720.1 hypothetical protein EPUS_04889 [Endocarpon pusillum Z07020]
MASQMLSLPMIVVGTLLFGRTTAWSAFNGNCTLPASDTNYVANPNARGTLGILWECLLIILLCTWSILHLNVPVIRPEPKTFFRKCGRLIEDSWPKAKWMALTIFVPEYIIAKALTDLLAARNARNHGVQIAPTVTQAHLANMGYFVLDTKGLIQDVADNSSQDTKQRVSAEPGFDRDKFWDDFYTNAFRLKNYPRLCKSKQFKLRYWALNVAQWHEISKVMPNLVDFPELSHAQLQQLGGQDALVTLLALVQIIYVIIQLIVRQSQNLPVSQLEVATLAFAVSSVFTYALYWTRPQNVQSFYVIQPNRKLSTVDFQRLVDAIDRYPSGSLWLGGAAPRVFPDLGPSPIPNDATARIGKGSTGQAYDFYYSSAIATRNSTSSSIAAVPLTAMDNQKGYIGHKAVHESISSLTLQ